MQGAPLSLGNSSTLPGSFGCRDVTCDVTPRYRAVCFGGVGLGDSIAGASGSSASAASSSVFRRTWLYTPIMTGETCPNCAPDDPIGHPLLSQPGQRRVTAVVKTHALQARGFSQ